MIVQCLKYMPWKHEFRNSNPSTIIYASNKIEEINKSMNREITDGIWYRAGVKRERSQRQEKQRAGELVFIGSWPLGLR